MSLYSFGKLSAGYGSKQVINEISGEIPSGKITALIGPNGGGKSTLLRVLGGLGSYGGSLSLGAREVREISRRDFGKIAGFLPQSINVKAAFSVYEIISLGRLPFHGVLGSMKREDDEIVLRCAESAGVGHLLFRTGSELSGGERQRVLFAMILAQQPEIFLLDEPTSALDPSHTRRIFSLLRELTAQGKSAVTAVHDLNSAVACCDCFAALKDGRIIASGTVDRLDENILFELYGIKFSRYKSEKGNVVWYPE